MQRLSELEKIKKRFLDIKSAYEDLCVMEALLQEEFDPELSKEMESLSLSLTKDIRSLLIEILMTEEFDKNSAIVSIHPGAGGVDSQDWAEMLLRMYIRWAQSHGYNVKLTDRVDGNEAGIKSATLIVEGDYAYGYLKAERGIHRLIRLSPFDASHRRHTSFASVDVIPEITDDITVEIRNEDLKIETFRASGAGGQYVNMTDSAVRITHIPTGIVVSCQNERSQYMNKQTALKILKARLYKLQLEERKKQIEQIQGEKRDIAWGNQIRTYVLHPHTFVKDHRTGCEVFNVQKVLDGEIDIFIMEYLKYLNKKEG